MTTKLVDSKGRLLLGSRFAGRLVIIDDSNPNRIILRLAEPIPQEELWLYSNRVAWNRVRKGLEQMRKGEFSESPPDLDADAILCDDD